MTDRARRIGPGARFPCAQSLEIGGKLNVLLPIKEYEDLREKADRPREDVSPLGAESVGRDLRSRRHRVRRTLSEVASKTGIAAETLSRIETGKTNPSVRTVRSILRALTGWATAVTTRPVPRVSSLRPATEPTLIFHRPDKVRH